MLPPARKPVALHCPPQTTVYDLRVCGNLVECQETWNWQQTPREKRGTVSELFTRASRLRMLKEIAQIHWLDTIRYSLITLTYPDSVAFRSLERHTIDRSRFVRDLERTVGKPIGILWRKEWKERQSGLYKGQMCPHWHLLCFDMPWVDHKEIRGLWRSILAHGGPVATDVREARSGKLAAFYASKYAAKASSCSLDNVAYLNYRWGRPWGFLRKGSISYYEPKIIRNLSPDEFALVRQLAASQWKGIKRNDTQGFSLFGDCGNAIYRSVLKMRLARERQSG